jgi:hypothetical protein
LVIDLLYVLRVTKDGSCPADRPVQCLVLGLEGTCGHAGKSRRRTELNKAFELERSEEKILGFDPTNGRDELVGKELNKNGISELLAVLGASPFIFFPLLEDLVEARRRGLIVDDLSVLARDLEGFGDEVRNLFPNKHVGVQVRGIDLLGQVCRH